MGLFTAIQWTLHTFNFWIGCTKVSEACRRCFAWVEEAVRYKRVQWGAGKPRYLVHDWSPPLRWNTAAKEAGQRHTVFDGSLMDFFDAEVNPEWRKRAWEIKRATCYLDWLTLTKRPQNMRSMLPPDWGDGYDNVCLIVSVEDQARADERIPILIVTPAKKRGLSIEPLLGPIMLSPSWFKRLDWVICGGESGTGSRPMHPDWVRSVRDQCAKAGIPFFFKQWGNWSPDASLCKSDYSNVVAFIAGQAEPIYLETLPLEERKKFILERPATLMYRSTKHEARNFLDGRQHLDQPFEQPITPGNEIQPAIRQKFEAPRIDTSAIVARARKLATDYIIQ